MKTNRKTVILDLGLQNDKVFSKKEIYKISHTLLPFYNLFLRAKKEGIDLITPEEFFKLNIKSKKILLISHMTSKYTSKLLAQNVIPAILFCLESPFFAQKFYLNIQKISKKFDQVFLFEGLRKKINPKKFNQIFFPQPYSKYYKTRKWSDRNFLVMINRNPLLNLKEKVFAKIGEFILNKLNFNFNSIEKERFKALEYFTQKENFYLFGKDWDKPISFGSKNSRKLIKKVYQGTTKDKIKTLNNFKFSICFENAEFEGYVTEKIFDSLYAGCIPIYLGAPDISKYVPSDLFIDFRKFKNYEKLDSHLKEFNEIKYQKFITSVNKFFSSKKYKLFNQETFIKKFIDIINSYYND